MTLVFERTPHRFDTLSRPDTHLLGQRLQRGSGEVTPGAPALLHPPEPVIERWLSNRASQHGQTGCIHHAFDGAWLYGAARLDVPSHGRDLQERTRQLYADLFRVLRSHPGLHLLKIWNYLPDINADLDGLELYRHFNIGRQQAFLDAGQSAFEGAPAACALGHHGGPLTLAFLAGPVAPRPVENPRQTSAYHYPSEYGPRSPTFSRAALVELAPGLETLFISGTASIVGDASVHRGDVVRQTEETLRNLAALLDAVHARTSARFELSRMDHTIYLRHAADLPRVRAVFEQAVQADSPAACGALYLHADICRSELLVEIEVQGSARLGAAA
ncbi:MAG: hypothetical protein AB3X44_15585 [Leptothrix sp. (in: b-proteobacteria)]